MRWNRRSPNVALDADHIEALSIASEFGNPRRDGVLSKTSEKKSALRKLSTFLRAFLLPSFWLAQRYRGQQPHDLAR
jgi:hypothetical protein